MAAATELTNILPSPAFPVVAASLMISMIFSVFSSENYDFHFDIGQRVVYVCAGASTATPRNALVDTLT